MITDHKFVPCEGLDCCSAGQPSAAVCHFITRKDESGYDCHKYCDQPREAHAPAAPPVVPVVPDPLRKGLVRALRDWASDLDKLAAAESALTAEREAHAETKAELERVRGIVKASAWPPYWNTRLKQFCDAIDCCGVHGPGNKSKGHKPDCPVAALETLKEGL